MARAIDQEKAVRADAEKKRKSYSTKLLPRFPIPGSQNFFYWRNVFDIF